MQGMIEAKRRKGCSRSRWIDQIRSPAGLPLLDFYALAEDRHGDIFLRSQAVSQDRNEPIKIQLQIQAPPIKKYDSMGKITIFLKNLKSYFETF